MNLRPYQQTTSDAAIAEMRRAVEPIMIEAATGAGKSLIIAEIARIIHQMTGKRVLCTAPSAELVIQNREKYIASGNPASMFSASAGQKSLRHPVVFGSPLTIKNRISAFCHGGTAGYALVVIDECDQLTPTLKSIIEAMRDANPNLRVLGLTATPYRLGSGYIFREWPDGRINGEDVAREPYFGKSVYQIGARELIDEGYLTKPVIGEINSDRYDTHNLIPNKQGKFDATEVDRAYHGHGRKTAAIIGDIVHQARDRSGVLIYAATVQHAHEVLASLPPELSEIVTAETKNRKQILDRLKAKKLKYVVNVGVLTVGIDVPHIDVIAILRKTESVRLLQQIIGRGLRLFEGKDDCLVLDYTTNLEDHCPDGDLFSPIVTAKRVSEATGAVTAICPDCSYENQFSRHRDAEGYQIDAHGYCLDTFGERVETEFGPMPGHYGRRCFGMVAVGRGQYDRCGYRWTSKECPHCTEPNDIAARYCHACRGEIVDPNEKLAGDFRAFKRDPSQIQTDRVLSMNTARGVSSKGNATCRIDWETEYRKFSVWLMPEAKYQRARLDWDAFNSVTDGGSMAPETITYVKDEASGFFRMIAYGRTPDIMLKNSNEILCI